MKENTVARIIINEKLRNPMTKSSGMPIFCLKRLQYVCRAIIVPPKNGRLLRYFQFMHINKDSTIRILVHRIEPHYSLHCQIRTLSHLLNDGHLSGTHSDKADFHSYGCFYLM